MAKKLFVGNINWNASKEDLENIFGEYGELEEAILIKDENGRSKGF
jgi:RNA recognition motif-containing protein